MSVISRVLLCALSCAVVPPLFAQQAEDPFGGATQATSESGASAPRESVAAVDWEARIEAVLAAPLKAPLAFVETPLKQVLSILSEEYGIQIVIDNSAFDALAISPDTDVDINIRNMSLASALDLIFKSPALEDVVYIVDHEVLLITSRDEADARIEVRVYRVDDLVRDETSGDIDFDSLIDLIISTISQNSWQENGAGVGEVQPLMPGILVIAHTRPIHQQITDLLAEIREAKAAIEADRDAKSAAADAAPVTRAIRIQNVWGEDPQTAFQVIREAILRSVSWDGHEATTEDEPYLAVLPDRVVIRHLPHVIDDVEDVLHDLDLAKPAKHSHARRGSSRGGGRGGGGGFFSRTPE